MGIELGHSHDLAVRLESLESKVDGLATQDLLQNASIGAGGLTVEGAGGVTVTGGGSLTITGTGTLNVASGGLNSAGSISAGTSITAGSSITAAGDITSTGGNLVGGNVTASGSVSAGGDLSVAGNASIGGTMTATGDIFTPNATPAVPGYTVCYLNVDGRVSKGSSSARYKVNIVPVDPASLGSVFPQLNEYEMRADPDHTVRVGHIAEQLAADPALERFVVYADVNGERVPESIDFISLLLAQTAQLDERLKRGRL